MHFCLGIGLMIHLVMSCIDIVGGLDPAICVIAVIDGYRIDITQTRCILSIHVVHDDSVEASEYQLVHEKPSV